MRSVFLLMIVCCGCGPAIDLPPISSVRNHNQISPVESAPRPLKIIVIDVGQGDAALIVTPAGEGMLIDCGPEEEVEQVRAVLSQESMNSLKAIFVSHYHIDHMGGCVPLVAGPDGKMGTDDDVKVEEGILDRGDPTMADSSIFENYTKAFTNMRHTVVSSDAWEWDGLSMKALIVGGRIGQNDYRDENTEENALSMGLILQYGDFRYFTSGDLTGGGGGPEFPTTDLETIVGPLVGDVDVLHVGHHGSYTSTNQNFLAALQPAVGIISVGAGNEYHHPHSSVLERLKKSGVNVLRTDQGGDITVESDGNNYQITRILY